LPLETEPEIAQYRDDRNDNAERAGLDKFAGNAWANDLSAADFIAIADRVSHAVDRGLLRDIAAWLKAERKVTSEVPPKPAPRCHQR